MNSLSARSYRLNVLADDFLRAEPDKGPQAEKKNQQIVDLTEAEKNIRQEINGHNNVRQQQDEQELRPQGNTAVFQQSPEEPQKTWQMIEKL